jgi:CRISPR-associated protein Csm1
LYRAIDTPAASAGPEYFTTAETSSEPPDFDVDFREGMEVGWSADRPAEVTGSGGTHRWKLGQDIPFARHVAPDDQDGAATPELLASRAEGRPLWGMLRGEVDDFEGRLRRAQTAEEHLQLSMMLKQFFIGELQMRCSLPEFWRKVTLIRADGPEFAVLGSWDALMALARETWRLFGVFADANLREYAGAEGKTMSLAIALARGESDTPESLYAVAGDRLRAARSVAHDSIWVLGRILDARQFSDAAESRATMTRLIREFGVPPQLLDELAAFYREGSATVITPGGRRTNARVERPWRFYRRLNTLMRSQTRNRDFVRLRADLISDFTGRRASAVRLRPHGRVALEWAKLETDSV